MHIMGATMRRVLLLLTVQTICLAKPQVSENVQTADTNFATFQTPPNTEFARFQAPELAGFQTPPDFEDFTPSPASIDAVKNGVDVKDLAPRFFFPMGMGGGSGKATFGVKTTIGLGGSIGGGSD